MQEELEALRAEVAALRAEVAQARGGQSTAITRRRLLTGLAGLGAAGAAGVVTASPAGADDHEALMLGESNAATIPTTLQHDSSADEHAFAVRTSSSVALFACTDPAGEPITGGSVKRAIYAAASVEENEPSFAISAFAGNGFAVEGANDSLGFPAIAGINQAGGPGLAAQSDGHGPQLLLALESSAPAGPPGFSSEAGGIRFDSAGDLWLCTADTPDTEWTRLLREDTAVGRVIPITPIRAIDTRASGGRPAGSPAIPGQKTGPLKGGTSLTLDLAGIGPIPATVPISACPPACMH